MKRFDIHRLRSVAALLLLGLIAAPAQAGLITLTFDTIPVADCDEPWVESECTLMLVETTEEDCSEGNCFWGTDTPGALWLYPARLDIGFHNLTDLYVDWVEIDVDDYCGGCSMAFLYDDLVVLDSASPGGSGETTLVLTRDGGMPDHMAVSSCEAAFLEIRIHTEGVPVAPSNWSAVKVLY